MILFLWRCRFLNVPFRFYAVGLRSYSSAIRTDHTYVSLGYDIAVCYHGQTSTIRVCHFASLDDKREIFHSAGYPFLKLRRKERAWTAVTTKIAIAVNMR